MSFEIFCPGAFDCYFSGTGVIQGDVWDDTPAGEAAAAELREAYAGRTIFKRGKGYTFGLRLTDVEAVGILASYAYWCLQANYHGDKEHSEIAACRKVLERCETATGGRVSFDGWNVYVNGEKAT